jgi:hypothetical protein
VSNIQSIINLVLKAVAVGMSVATIVLMALDAVPLETAVTLLAIGVFVLAVALLSTTDSTAGDVE